MVQCNLTPSSGRADGGTFGIGSFRTPLDFVFYFSIVNSVFAVLGFAGVINGQRELVTGFFVYNAVQMVRPCLFTLRRHTHRQRLAR